MFFQSYFLGGGDTGEPAVCDYPPTNTVAANTVYADGTLTGTLQSTPPLIGVAGTITIEGGVESRQFVDGQFVTARLLNPEFQAGDVTITINGVTTNTANPPVETDGVLTLELEDFENVEGAVIKFRDLDGEWNDLDVLISEDAASLRVKLDKYIRPNKCGLPT